MPMRGAPCPPEFREEAIRLYRSSERSISKVAEKLGRLRREVKSLPQEREFLKRAARGSRDRSDLLS